MVFNSIQFLIFFPIVILLYFLVEERVKNIILLVASYYFYMCWNPGYALLILFSTVTTFFTGYLIVHAKAKHRKTALAINILINLGILFFFKYYNFFNESLAQLLSLSGIDFIMPSSSFLLPVGISFYTFQALGYSIDVYRHDIEHEHNFINYALFVSFFPQLVAGPIERSKNLLPQFKKYYTFDYERVTSGLRLMLWGFFKKVVIADNLSVIVDNVYNNPANYTGIPIIIATLAFTFQIFCDFSGYSDIARGSARVLGFNLMTNFNNPYSSKSVREFWSRWHISLSTWFKDYLYIPLGGSKVSNGRWAVNIMITFLVSGLWHGANWTFFIWGCLHGLYQIISKATLRTREKVAAFIRLTQFPRIHSIIQVTITFLLISFAWIFFRANNLGDAEYLIKNLINITVPTNFGEVMAMLNSFGCTFDELIAIIPAWIVMETVQVIQIRYSINDMFKRKTSFTRKIVYIFFILYILIFGSYGNQTFIYFQF